MSDTTMDGGAVMPELKEGEASAAEYRGLMAGAELGAAAAGAAAGASTAAGIAAAMPATSLTAARRNRRLTRLPAEVGIPIFVYTLPGVAVDVLVERVVVFWSAAAVPAIGSHLAAAVVVAGTVPAPSNLVSDTGDIPDDAIPVAFAYPLAVTPGTTVETASAVFDFAQPVLVPALQSLVVYSANNGPAPVAAAQWIEVPGDDQQ